MIYFHNGHTFHFHFDISDLIYTDKYNENSFYYVYYDFTMGIFCTTYKGKKMSLHNLKLIDVLLGNVIFCNRREFKRKILKKLNDGYLSNVSL